MPRILIVAYGNPLRCDDSVALRAAEMLESKFPASEVEILQLHQLAPEVADAVRQRNLAVFLDAAAADTAGNDQPGEVFVRDITDSVPTSLPTRQFSHAYSPQKVLHLARELYQATPKAFVLTITGEDFGHGDGLSASVKAALPTLVAKVEQIVHAHLSKP